MRVCRGTDHDTDTKEDQINSILNTSLRTLLTHPDHPDQDALFAVLANTHATTILSCLAPPESLLQITAALARGCLWCLDGWDRQTDTLVGLITDSRCPFPNRMIMTWSRIPNTVGVLRDRSDALVAWAQQQIYPPTWYANLALLLGPSNAAARLLVQSPFSDNIGTTLRRWSMDTDPEDPTAWQAMIDPDLRATLHKSANPSAAFPAWRRGDAVASGGVLHGIVDDLVAGWSPDHPSIRRRIRWLEHHVDSNLGIGPLSILASIGRSDALAEAVCARVVCDPTSIPRIADDVPWSRLHPQIQTVIDTTMRRSSDDRWKRTWAFAIGQAPGVPDATIDADLRMWRIAPERWNDRDPSIRAAFVRRRSYLPHHCYGWGVHPDLLGQKFYLQEDVFYFWNTDVPPDDLHAWSYAEILQTQSSLQDAQEMIALLDVLPSKRRARFEAIIDGQLGDRPEATAQPPWEWADWVALPVPDRQTRLRDRLAVLWGDYATSPAVRCRRARNDGLATLALMVGEVLGLDDPIPLLAALIAQVWGLRGDENDIGSSLPFPDKLDAALRAQIERLPIAPNAQAYAAWCLRVLDQDMGLGSTLIALHPDVAVALAPVLTDKQRADVAASPAAQGWDSITILRWEAICASAKELPMHPIQRRIA